MIDMLGVRWPKTAMIVWMRAPPSAPGAGFARCGCHQDERYVLIFTG